MSPALQADSLPDEPQGQPKNTGVGSLSLLQWIFPTQESNPGLLSPLNCKEIQPVYSEDQPWDFFGRNDATAETPVLWPPRAKS